eukprot:9315900-Alexandrium_andersonii.AAC.1
MKHVVQNLHAIAESAFVQGISTEAPSEIGEANGSAQERPPLFRLRCRQPAPRPMRPRSCSFPDRPPLARTRSTRPSARSP